MKPKVTIGVPVYNGEKIIRQCLNAMLEQTFTDFELIISDNASSDKTEQICREYESHDKRVTYIRHQENMGTAFNFKFLMEKSIGEYFMWAAVDDIRSPDFLAIHVNFLDNNPSYVSSTSPTIFDGKKVPDEMMGDWMLDQDRVALRMLKFFSCWHANSHFYGLHRRSSVIKWPEIYLQGFHGDDWTLVMHLASLGKLNRSNQGWVKFGPFGISAKRNLFAFYRKNWLDYFIPFHKTSRKAINIVNDAGVIEWINLLYKLLKFNIKGFKAQLNHDKWDKRLAQIIEVIRLDDKDIQPKFVICGAGDIGRRLYNCMSDHGIAASLFTDKVLSGQELVFDGVSVPVVRVSDAIERGFTCFIIASKEFSTDITHEVSNEAELRKLQVTIIRLYR
ncbi:glycosyltransferase family 2 protein [Aeromonas dhakensis]|uniref:glycosyltransferase family 2 protein n=1 Tax=Aeromonas dhakensis TaxID=196024 RepID=UPI0019800B41|nr:glycosyltransferase family A protein [Aeromonas dhakensis]MBW3733657.1 glycosyltransferase family 2 protein [Aeromonas dhakensis]QSR54114.1 glycosyltransferase [Aeromonas dhakensis]